MSDHSESEGDSPPTNPSQSVSTQTTQTIAAGPVVDADLSTVPFRPPLQPVSSTLVRVPKPAGCVVDVDPLATPIVLADSTASGKSITMKFIMNTKCTSTALMAPMPFPASSTLEVNQKLSTTTQLFGGSLGSQQAPLTTMREKGSLVVVAKPPDFMQTRTTLVTTVLTSTAAVTTTLTPVATTIAKIAPATGIASPNVTPITGKHRLFSPQIGLFVSVCIIGLLFLIAIIFFVRCCLRRRKETRHGNISHFWRGTFAPSQPTDHAVPLSTLERGPSPTSPPIHPSDLANPYPNPDSAPRSALKNQPSSMPAAKSPLSSFAAAIASEKRPGTSHKHAGLFQSQAAVDREVAQARARAAKQTANTNFEEANLELGTGEAEFVEICLDEEVALDEQEKAEKKWMQERAEWDAARRSMSPFPRNPFSYRPRGPMYGR